jgi:hypothetical protein
MWKGRSHQELARAFAQEFPDEGELVDLSLGDSPLRQEAAMARRIAALYWPRDFAASCSFDFECVVSDSYLTNAFAAHAGNIHWISITTGMLFTLAELSVRVGAEFPVPADNEPPVTLTGADGVGFRYDRADFDDSIDKATQFFRQTDKFGPTRLRLVNAIWLDAQTIIWRHEMFHSSLGHTRYLAATFGLKSFNEYPDRRRPAPPPNLHSTLRALEFHADWAAFGSVLKMSQSNFDATGSDLQKRFGLTWRAASLMAAMLLMPAFFRVAELRGAPESVTHPSAAARLSIFLTRILELPDPSVREEWTRGTGLALQAFRSMAAKHADFQAFDDMLSDSALDAGDAERIACVDDFDALQDKLIPYAVLPLGHPHQGSVEPLRIEEDR